MLKHVFIVTCSQYWNKSNNLPFPFPLISSLLGENFCSFINFLGGLYVGGGITWSFCIAVVRVIFVKGQTDLKNFIGRKLTLLFMIVAGWTITVSYSLLFVIFDDKVPTQKMCNHHSNEFIDMLADYQVCLFIISMIIIRWEAMVW